MLRHAFGLIFLVLIHVAVTRNFQCFYDFDGALMCEFTPEKLANCSKYSLNVEFSPDDPDPQRKYNYLLSDSGVKCVFTIDIDDGLLYGENCTVTLKRNGQIEDDDIIDTKKNIKLKTPTINSANTTEGKTIVTWLTHYKSDLASGDLKTELQLKRGKAVNWEYSVIEKGIRKTQYEFYDLVPNIEYVVRARVFIEDHHSEWSKGKRFFSASLIDIDVIKKIVVPVLCLILVLTVCTLACCCVKIKKNGQSKNSFFPKIEFIDNPVRREDRILCPEKTPTSKIEVFIPKQYMADEKKSITTPSVSDSNSGNSSLAVSTESNSTSADLGHACHVRKSQNQSLERLLSAVQQDMVRGCRILAAPGTKLLDMPVDSDYESVSMQESQKACAPISASHSDSGCISGSSGCASELYFDNLCYSAQSGSLPSEPCGFVPSLFCDLDLACQSNEGFGQLVLKETDERNVVLPPLIQTELVYRPSADLISEAECRPQALGVNEPCGASEDANRSLVKLMGQGVSIYLNRTGQGIEEEKDVAWRWVCSKSLLHPCPFTLEECSLLQSDDEYRSVQSLISS